MQQAVCPTKARAAVCSPVLAYPLSLDVDCAETHEGLLRSWCCFRGISSHATRRWGSIPVACEAASHRPDREMQGPCRCFVGAEIAGEVFEPLPVLGKRKQLRPVAGEASPCL